MKKFSHFPYCLKLQSYKLYLAVTAESSHDHIKAMNLIQNYETRLLFTVFFVFSAKICETWPALEFQIPGLRIEVTIHEKPVTQS
jgi:hypothetical protein